MKAKEIEKLVQSGLTETYHPHPVSVAGVHLARHGTEIVLSDLKKSTSRTEASLRKRIARRFSIIGPRHKFIVRINGKEISIGDRDYFNKLQYIWYFGKESAQYIQHCDGQKLKSHELRNNKIDGYSVSGWIGSVEKSGLLKDKLDDDNLNKIVIMVRGKLAQEDILEDFAEGGVYTKYLIGEIHADFLDADEKDDIATTSRQEIIRDDPRYQALKKWVSGELKHIEQKWTDLRNKEGAERAFEIPAIREWFKTLGRDLKKRAEALFGKINQLPIDSDADRKELFKHAVLAFESLKYRQNLDALDDLAPDAIYTFAKVFDACEDIEKSLYYQVVRLRLGVIRKLHEQTRNNALEKIVQKHLYENLWLLDTGWDRATETPVMEQDVRLAFSEISRKVLPDERRGRVDIRYKKTAGIHVIIELKRADRALADTELMSQVDKYRRKLLELLQLAGKQDEPVEVVCIVGKPLKEWTNPEFTSQSRKALEAVHIRVVTYQELVEDAYRSYSSFLEVAQEVGRVQTLLKEIERTPMPTEASVTPTAES